MVKRWAILLTLLLASTACGQSVLVLDLGNDTQIAMVTLASGEVVVIPQVTVFKIPPPTPPQPQVTWKVAGLHVMIVDNENLRGNLPQSQINLLSSVPFRQWLIINAKGYRFSSNDSLVEGSEARDLELPVWVQGWDLLMESEQELPLWIIGNGRQTVIEPLPLTVEAAIRRLEGLR